MNFNPTSGARAAAFVDLDGTLIAEPSLEIRLFRALRQHGDLSLSNYARWAVEAARLFRGDLTKVQYANKQYLHGVERDLIFQHVTAIPIFDEAISRLAWHLLQQHLLVLVSGTLEPLAHMAATAIECELEARGLETSIHVCATRLEEKSGRWTGRLAGDAIYGQAKRDAIQHYAKQHDLNLHDCYAYGNTVLDSYMLSAVGCAQVVNPGKQLANLANLYNWPVWHWHHQKNVQPAVTTLADRGIQQLESGV